MSKLLMLMLLLCPVYADEPSQINMSHEFSNTSDGLKLKTNSITFETNRRDIFWNYEDAIESANDLSFGVVRTDGEHLGEISGNKLFAGYGKKWSKNSYTDFRAGVHNLEYRGVSSSTPYIELGHKLRYGKNTLDMNIIYDYFYTSGGVPGPYENKLKKLQSDISAVYTPKDFLRIPYGIKYSKISQDNSSNSQNVSVLAGSSYPIWFWLGYRLSRLSYDRRDTGYWSPEKFLSHGPQVEWSQVFFSKLTVKASYLYSFIKEDDFSSGNSYYASSALEYGSRNTWLIGASIFRNKSQQGSSEWWSEGGELYYKHSF